MQKKTIKADDKKRDELWAVHPNDIAKLGTKTRQEFYKFKINEWLQNDGTTND